MGGCRCERQINRPNQQIDLPTTHLSCGDDSSFPDPNSSLRPPFTVSTLSRTRLINISIHATPQLASRTVSARMLLKMSCTSWKSRRQTLLNLLKRLRKLKQCR